MGHLTGTLFARYNAYVAPWLPAGQDFPDAPGWQRGGDQVKPIHRPKTMTATQKHSDIVPATRAATGVGSW